MRSADIVLVKPKGSQRSRGTCAPAEARRGEGRWWGEEARAAGAIAEQGGGEGGAGRGRGGRSSHRVRVAALERGVVAGLAAAHIVLLAVRLERERVLAYGHVLGGVGTVT